MMQDINWSCHARLVLTRTADVRVDRPEADSPYPRSGMVAAAEVLRRIPTGQSKFSYDMA
jgi:hypothetical protein